MAVLPILLAAATAAAGPTVTVIGFSDYHSHAVPFRSEGRDGQGGLARAVAYLRAARAQGPTLVLSGGDMLNAGSPTWSDEYRCVEWPWLNGLVDAMALGNHDLDYGWGELERCRAAVDFPVLSANLVGPDGGPLLRPGGKPYAVREVNGIRFGLFAVAGTDFARLVKPDHLPPGARWDDPQAAARRIVETLRGAEKVDVVIAIGHQHRADDEALARAVPGIDLILGSHSHLKVDLARVPGTTTWYLSPFQYLAYAAEVRLRFEGRRLAAVEGGLVRIDDDRPVDAEVATRVATLQRDLEARRPERFRVLGRLDHAFDDTGVTTGPCSLGTWATEQVRRAAGLHAFFSTASSFRGGLAAGPVTVEALSQAIPYDNEVVRAEMTGAQLRAWVQASLDAMGSDGLSQQSGLRYAPGTGRIAHLEVLRDPDRPEAGYQEVDATATYRIGTTDFQAFVSPRYRDLFAAAGNARRTGLDVRRILTAAIAAGTAAP